MLRNLEQLHSGHDLEQQVGMLMIDMLVMALACDLTSVASLEQLAFRPTLPVEKVVTGAKVALRRRWAG